MPVSEWWWALLMGLVVGAGVGLLWGRARVQVLTERLRHADEALADVDRLRQDNERLREQKVQLEMARVTEEGRATWLDGAQAQLREAFEALAGRALASNSESFLTRARDQLQALVAQAEGEWRNRRTEFGGLLEPLGESLRTMDAHIRALEQKREGDYRGLEEQIRQLGETSRRLGDSTTDLTRALKAPAIRGRWGEVQLRRVVEMAGLVHRVDFVEQVTTEGGRPDLIVNLPQAGILPVDAKTPMQSFMAATGEDNEGARRAKLDEHAKAMRQRVQELGERRYWSQFPRAPELVVMFLPNDGCLSAVLERDGEFLDYAIGRNVLPASPITLLALLKAVAFGWQQQQVSDSAAQIAETGRELFERIGVFIDHLRGTGRGLETTVESYNKAIGSLESRLMPAVRRLQALGVSGSEIEPAKPVTREARGVAEGGEEGPEVVRS